MADEELKITWWNTSADPYGESNSHSDQQVIQDDIIELCLSHDLIVLGEYCNTHLLETAIADLNLYCARNSINKNIILQDLFFKNSRLEIHNLLCFNDRKLAFHSIENFTTANNGILEKQYRIGQRVRLYSLQLSKWLDIYVVHWSMHSESNGNQKKVAAATRLHRDIFEDGNPENLKICMGDFNTEPYSDPLIALSASRSQNYVKKRGGLFNPFWKFLHDSGTIRAQNIENLKCDFPVFDQILLNQVFFKTGSIISLDPKIISLAREISHSEHLPVSLTINIKGGD